MIHPEIKALTSDALNRPALPDDESNVCVSMVASIGPKDGAASELFYFEVVTPEYLANADISRWGRGLLVVPEFDWAQVDRALERLVAQSAQPSWEQVREALSRELTSEYEGYRRHAS